MEHLFQLAQELEKYQRLEAERRQLVQQIVLLEVEASREYMEQ